MPGSGWRLGARRCGGKQREGRRRGAAAATLQLTPLIDCLLCVLFFLIVTFSASGEVICLCHTPKLPIAERATSLERAPVIAMSFPPTDPAGGVVTVDGDEVSTVRELLEDSHPDWKIARLTEQLETIKHNWKSTNPDRLFPGDVILQVDEAVDYQAVKKVIYSCGLAGYAQLSLAVYLPDRRRPAPPP